MFSAVILSAVIVLCVLFFVFRDQLPFAQRDQKTPASVSPQPTATPSDPQCFPNTAILFGDIRADSICGASCPEGVVCRCEDNSCCVDGVCTRSQGEVCQGARESWVLSPCLKKCYKDGAINLNGTISSNCTQGQRCPDGQCCSPSGVCGPSVPGESSKLFCRDNRPGSNLGDWRLVECDGLPKTTQMDLELTAPLFLGAVVQLEIILSTFEWPSDVVIGANSFSTLYRSSINNALKTLSTSSGHLASVTVSSDSPGSPQITLVWRTSGFPTTVDRVSSDVTTSTLSSGLLRQSLQGAGLQFSTLSVLRLQQIYNSDLSSNCTKPSYCSLPVITETANCTNATSQRCPDGMCCGPRGKCGPTNAVSFSDFVSFGSFCTDVNLDARPCHCSYTG